MESHSIRRPTVPTVTFHGAAQSVTGSMHLLEAGPLRLLLDCGLTRGEPEEARRRNRDFPFDPASLTAVVISHAHVDHCGNLANLVRQGFRGPVYCTPATRDLLGVVLPDSARIQEEDTRVASVVAAGARARPERGRDGPPLFTSADVRDALELCVAVPYGRPAAVSADCELTFHDAGHVLGSAIVALKVHSAGRDWRVTFTGDLGRRGLPFLKAPSPVPAADLIVCESTYGGRTHDTAEGMARKMADVIHRTVERGGKVLVPAFSLGRTQIVEHYLRRWMGAGALPRLPLFVDSPLASQIADVYELHDDALAEDEAPAAPAAEHLGTREEGDEVTRSRGPCVIIASGGMCDGGRIVHHLRHHVDDPRSSLVLVSYQAPHSLGARLLEKRPTVRFHGRTWNKWVEVAQLNGFSGHADQNDFLALLGPAAGATGKVRLVHGEPEQAEALAAFLRANGFADVSAPRRDEVVSVG